MVDQDVMKGGVGGVGTPKWEGGGAKVFGDNELCMHYKCTLRCHSRHLRK